MPGYDINAEPCSYCGTNAWTDCKHREGRVKPCVKEVAGSSKKDHTGSGFNFRSRVYISGGGRYKRKLK